MSVSILMSLCWSWEVKDLPPVTTIAANIVSILGEKVIVNLWTWLQKTHQLILLLWLQRYAILFTKPYLIQINKIVQLKTFLYGYS